MNAHKAKLLTYTRKTTGLIGLICTLAFSHLAGQVKEMPLDYLQRVYYSGSYVDYQIPEDITVDWLYLKVGGGDGGYYGMNDHNMTGKGATVEGYLPISSTKSSSSVLPGSVLRFIVGQEGHYGGGGGGTAVAIKNKGETTWTLLMVGGGGGGSSFWNKGDPGRTATSGSPGLGDTGGTLQNGGSNGEGGGMSGGGGYKGDGGQFKESDNPEAWAIRTVGKKGNNAANEPVGGQGGVGSDGSYGGFGYGSGGAGYWYNKDKRGEYMSGGGGGGYSGGGGGSNNFGGGGGSYANENLIQWPHIELQGYSSDLNDGYALFKLSSLNLMRPAKNTQLCLTDFSQGTAKGNNIDLSVCQDGGGQKWVFEENAVRYTETDNKCMDLKQSNMTDGANIQLWDCNNTGAQKWLYDGINRNIRLKMNIDWCLALEDGSAEDGHNVQLGKCNYSDSQQWEVSGLSQAEVSNYNRIRYLKDSGKCVDVQSSSTADGANVQIYHCGDTPSQYWYFEGNSIRFNKDHGKCLDLDYSKTDNRTNIQLWQCNGTRAQQWIYDGRTRTFRSAINPDKCLDVDNSGTADHTNIQLYDCNNTDAQQFIIEALPCVVDIVPPVAKCRDRTFTGLTAPVVADIDDGSYDNCTVSSRLLKNLSGNTYQLTIKDAAGNSSTCTARISY